jgi:Na+/H+ antiporter NhaD/arsenite permease-like protein
VKIAHSLITAAGAEMATSPAFAASSPHAGNLAWPLALPFAGILLSIAAGPLLFPKFWHAHYGKIALGWALITCATLAFATGLSNALAAVTHALLIDYLSFIILLFALYTVAGGILITGNLGGRPWSNVGVLAVGTALASVIGTTGAAMVLIRPLIRANESRPQNVHVIVFFIFLVCNVGGALSPLGDPPLFVGFLRGVDFFWPASHLWLQTLITVLLLLLIFFSVDLFHARREPAARKQAAPIRLRGLLNLPLVGLIIAAVLASALWQPGTSITVYGASLELQNLLRDGALLFLAALSVWLTPQEHREANNFTWEPIREVAKLFAGIFVCIVPVLAMLGAGREGPFAFLLTAVTAGDGAPHEAAYFWLTGILSAFLDNAPTYLAFFQLAGGDSRALMGPLAGTLAAISMGAVYMGALTYIGNAPNLMVQSIANESGIRMPGFFVYMLWAVSVLVPLFLLLTLLPISPILKLY